MRRIGLVGVDWRSGGTDALARYTIPREKRRARLAGLRERIGARELVYLATCNRVELTFVGEPTLPVSVYRQRIFAALRGRPPGPREAETALRAWGGEGAVEHVFRVASGLESALRGEHEIVGQMREAVDDATAAGTCGSVLGWVFAEAWRVGRDVRRTADLSDGTTSLAQVAMDRVRDRLQQVPGPVAIVGVSPMTVRCGEALRQVGSAVVVFNRTLGPAAELARQIGATAQPLDALRAGGDRAFSVIICATGSDEPVLRRCHLERLASLESGELPLVVDMAVPADVDPDAAAAAGLRRIDLEWVLDDAGGHSLSDATERAVEIIDRALRRLEDKLIDRLLAPMFAALQRRYRLAAEEGVARLRRRHLPNLSKAEVDALETWAAALARRFAHIPTTGLRALARTHGAEALERFFAGGEAALAAELAAARERAPFPVPDGLLLERVRHGRGS